MSLPDPISRSEIIQQLTDFRRTLASDLENTQEAIDSALVPLTLAVKRGVPGDWIVEETERRWRKATDAGIRVSFAGPVKTGTKHIFEEIRATPSTFVIGKKALQLVFNAWEPGFTVCRISVVLERRTISRSVQPLIEISLGALSDRAFFGSFSIAEAFAELSEYRLWTPILQSMSCRRHLILPTQAGFWRALTVEVGSRDIGTIPLVALYGWSADKEILTERAKQVLGQFRDVGWNHPSSADLIGELTSHILDQLG